MACYIPCYKNNSRLTLTVDEKPRLIVVVDTEEEFDWSKPFSRNSTSVTHVQESLWRLQEICECFAVKPVYVVDFPIASQSESWRPLQSLARANRASIGAHMHPWVTPPFDEELSTYHSYAGNLAEDLERAKLVSITEQIEASFCLRPTVFKAGRYGVGPNTFRILSELGYKVDLSPLPFADLSADGGPDFSEVGHEPFRDLGSGLLVLPTTGFITGWLPGNLPATRRWATTSWRTTVHANAVLYRLAALQRVWLAPELSSARDMRALTKKLLDQGTRCFVLSLHSTVVLPGATPFAKDEREVGALLKRLHTYFSYFFEELGGKPWTPEAALQHWAYHGNKVRSAVVK